MVAILETVDNSVEAVAGIAVVADIAEVAGTVGSAVEVADMVVVQGKRAVAVAHDVMQQQLLPIEAHPPRIEMSWQQPGCCC